MAYLDLKSHRNSRNNICMWRKTFENKTIRALIINLF